MDPQQQNPQGYAQLSEEDSSTNSPDVQGHPMNFAGQGNPVIVQGLPVMPMSYPAPMGNFEIYNPTPSQLQKLETCPYVCYKYWIAICIGFDGLGIFNSLASLLFMPPEFLLFFILGLIFRGWDMYQCIQIYLGIRDRVLEKVEKGIYLMKIFGVALIVVSSIGMIFLYEFVKEQMKRPEYRDIPNLPDLTPAIYGTCFVIGLAFYGCIWFFIMLYPAMQVRDILKSASGGQANVRHYANV